MKGDKIYYYDRGSFYTLSRQYSCQINIYPDTNIGNDFVKLSKDGRMTLERWYSSDGPSGLTVDTKSAMRSAFLHDGTFQLFRLKLLDLKWFGKANDNLRDFAIEDGMWKWRAGLWHSWVIQRAMWPAATNKKYEAEICAP